MNCLKCVTDTSDMACDLANSLLSLSINSPRNIPHLTDIDADLNMPLENNFCFYSTHDFHSNYDINKCLLSGQSFSLINCNIRSLSANYDKFFQTCYQSYIFLSYWLVLLKSNRKLIRLLYLALIYVDISNSPSQAFPMLGELLST